MLSAFILPILAITTTTTYCATTEDVKPNIQSSVAENSSMPHILDATASKLIRIRAKPPPNFFRYKMQQPQKRSRPRIVKSPKIKHNRPIFTHLEQTIEPSSYYKFQPEIHTSTLSYKPSHSYDEVHYEVSSEYSHKESIPLSNYETQAMELDFYGDTYPKKKGSSQYEYSKPQKASVQYEYAKPQKFAPQYEYSKPQKIAPQYEYSRPQKIAPQYEYAKPKKITPQYEYPKPQKTLTVQRPHKVYGVPKESSYNSYDFDFAAKPEVHYEISYHEETPEPEFVPAPQPKQKYEEFPPYGAPPKKTHKSEQVSYQIPDNKYEAPVGPYHPQELPSKEVPYQTYDKKLPNSGYNYNNEFAEPPTDIHIIHSPSYDIETLPPKHGSSQNSHEPAHETYGPPPREHYESNPNEGYAPHDYSKKSTDNHNAPVDSYHQPNGGQFAEPPGSYLPPPHQPEDLPLNKNHMPPGYDYPKSSYEVPIYDPIPFDQPTTPEEDYFPPNNHNTAPQHEHVSESSNHIEHIPSTSAKTTTSTTQEQEQTQQANTKVHRYVPNKRRFKNHNSNRYQTTAKVPGPTEEAHLSEAPSSEYLDEVLSTTSTFRPRRKRKRTKAPPVTEKHNLDAPELKEAFESGRDQSDELAAHASDIKENVEPQQSRPHKKLTEFSPTNTWNPMRIRTKHTNAERGQRTAEKNLNNLKNVEVISIQKSHSHSYYAGTEPPSTRRTKTMTSRADAMKMPTVSTTTLKAVNALKPTRGLQIDTTYFKVKESEEDEDEEDDEDFYDGTGKLPKNHKLF